MEGKVEGKRRRGKEALPTPTYSKPVITTIKNINNNKIKMKV